MPSTFSCCSSLPLFLRRYFYPGSTDVEMGVRNNESSETSNLVSTSHNAILQMLENDVFLGNIESVNAHLRRLDDSVTMDPTVVSDDSGRRIICSVIGAGLYDVAEKIIQKYPELSYLRNSNGRCALEMMARSPNRFLTGSHLSSRDTFIISCIDVGNKKSRNKKAVSLVNCIFENMASLQVEDYLKERSCDKKPEDPSSGTSILEIATKTGAFGFLKKCLERFPSLIWDPLGNEEGPKILSVAIMRRQESIFNLVYNINGFQEKMAAIMDGHGNTILHLAALWHIPRGTIQNPINLKIQRNLGSCVALQIQRELQWFQEVKSLLPLEYLTKTNNDNWTPQELFDIHHSAPIADAEKWTKETSQSGTLVSTLIATVTFASTFTVPGGYFSDNSDINKRGIPIFLHTTAFIVFQVANAMALFSSISSLLLFLGLQTSPFEDEDYLRFIPKRLIMGFITLFISIITLMIAFCAALDIILEPRYTWLPIPLFLAASIPVGLFTWSQFSLLVKMVVCTYGPSIFRRGRH